jgi:TetR/AcrR family transcriptional regulator, lmrAB and yxaGH operons repressor
MPRKNQARSQMVTAGADLLAERGSGTSLVKVADRASVPRGSIYWHFPNGRDELLVAIARQALGDIVAPVTRAAEQHSDPVTFVQELIDERGNLLRACGYQRGCLITAAVVGGKVIPPLQSELESALTNWTAAVARALQDKGVAAHVAEHTAQLLVGMLEGAGVVARASKSNQPFADLKCVVPQLLNVHRRCF